MALDAKFNDFKTKYGLEDEAMAEMLSIFNDSFIQLAHKLLQSKDIIVTQKQEISNKNKKWATKIAAEYAAENDLTLDDFNKEKITKKDIDDHIKKINGDIKKPIKPSITADITPDTKLDTTIDTTRKVSTKEKCCGITKNGTPCVRLGTEKPEGSSKCFCFRHAMDWKMYEISSDSDLEEEPKIHDDQLQ
tara:strand:- start:734 stop:1306 length:573 start_codon:yes stop_codon:yes gene_type:complete